MASNCLDCEMTFNGRKKSYFLKKKDKLKVFITNCHEEATVLKTDALIPTGMSEKASAIK